MIKRLTIAILIACLAIVELASPVRAETGQDELVTRDEALTVARNWIALIIQEQGYWGGSAAAEVVEIQQFKRGERVLGYFCSVKPQGFIVVSLRKELSPVKAYSAISNLDPESDEGLADLIKGGMERILDAIEEQLGPLASVQARDLESILEINYRQAWEELSDDEATPPGDFASHVLQDYQQGDVMLSSHWDQGDPYNSQVPAPPAGDDCTASRCDAGCIAIAGAQVMRYWNWPPFGEGGSPYTDAYNWPNMPDTLTGSSPAAQIDAVAELIHEVGIAAGMDYCGSSGCQSGACFASCPGQDDLMDAFEDHFRYSDADAEDRDDYTAEGWFNLIKGQLNRNRPLPYRVRNHAIVCDGWQEVANPPSREYHMNYGWGMVGDCQEGCDTWYTLDALHLGGLGEERIIRSLRPAPALGISISGVYAKPSFPYYRYFDRDATGDSAVFESGQNLQFLPNIVVTCTSATGGSIRFRGSSSDNTRLFTRGNTSRGVRIYNGAIKLNQGGSISFP
jgi:hypothetical protein